MEHFHERLQRAIKNAYLSQCEIARRLGVKQASVWEWLHVGYPSLEHFQQLCSMLNANPAYLLGLVD